MNGVLKQVEGFIQSGTTHHLMTVNIRFMSIARADRDFASIVNDAHLIVADGMPLVWMSRLIGAAVPQRITGSDLIYAFSEYASRKGLSVFFLGGKPGLADEAARKLTAKYPDLKIAGIYHGYFKSEQEQEVIDYIRACQPHFLFVGLGSPKQDFWISRWKDRLNIPVCVGIGGTMEVLTGRLKRAPVWMQRAGLEWFYRLKQEPRRLWRRYILEDVPTTLVALGFALRKAVSTRVRHS